MMDIRITHAANPTYERISQLRSLTRNLAGQCSAAGCVLPNLWMFFYNLKAGHTIE